MTRLLIIEDDQLVANIYRNKFSLEGFEVETAPDGQAGLEMLEQFQPALVILDLLLPRLDGVEVIKQIRSRPQFRELPVIVFSNTYLTHLVQEAWKAGATKILSKASCRPKEMIEAARSAIRQTGQPPAPNTASPQLPEAGDAEFRQSFLASVPAELGEMRSLLQAMMRARAEPNRGPLAQDLGRRAHRLAGSAALAGLSRIARLADALEALLRELAEEPARISLSTMRTAALAIDFLGTLAHRGRGSEEAEPASSPVLIVDDDAISRRAVAHALEKAKLSAVSVEGPEAAYAQLQRRRFSLVVLDVNMPGMNGYELCARLRALPEHERTPVVFVTSLDDFESRAHSTISGGNDFITKPFLFIELAVKALVHVLRGPTEAPPPVAARVPAAPAGHP